MKKALLSIPKKEVIRKMLKENGKVFRKEVSFEGYFNSCWETSYLSKRYEIPEKMQEWFKNYLIHLIEEKPSESLLFFEDIIPKEVYRKLLRNAKTKFRFKITVEVRE